MGQVPSSHHEPLDRARTASFRRSQRHARKGSEGSGGRMDRLRRSFRDSFRRRKEHLPESSKPHQWQADEAGVRSGTCNFHVKYLGCVEVFESRGMQVCEEALKVLRNSRRRPVKAILYVSGDGLRVVEDETKGLIVDQTIEKVSFCAPDRNHEKGFSYICRDGTTRRWMCHGFLALKESGERLSHAVGCAFAACLERKQRRDKECGVTMSFDPKNSTFTRQGSFRQQSLTERIENTAAVPGTINSDPIQATNSTPAPPPAKAVVNPFAIERPHATMSMLQRQGSFRGFQQLSQASPFKRQMSLRLGELPSNLERQRSLSLESSNDLRLPPRLRQMANKQPVSPIPEVSPVNADTVSAMCQQLSHGLSLLTNDDPNSSSQSFSTSISKQLFADITNSPNPNPVNTSMENSFVKLNNSINNNNLNQSVEEMSKPAVSSNLWSSGAETSINTSSIVNSTNNSTAIVPWGTPNAQTKSESSVVTSVPATIIPAPSGLPKPDQWLGSLVKASPPSRRAPTIGQHSRAHSLGSAEAFFCSNGDPFDAEWAALAAGRSGGAAPPTAAVSSQAPIAPPPPPIAPTNPFAFQIQM